MKSKELQHDCAGLLLLEVLRASNSGLIHSNICSDLEMLHDWSLCKSWFCEEKLYWVSEISGKALADASS